MSVNGEYLFIKFGLKIKNKDVFEFEDWKKHIKELDQINGIIEDTIKRFSDELKCISKKILENSSNIVVGFLKDIDLSDLEEKYKDFEKSIKKYKDEDIINYVYNKIEKMLDHDFYIYLSKSKDFGYSTNSGVDIDLFYDDVLIGTIGYYNIGDPLEEITIDYDEVEYLNAATLSDFSRYN
jgi:hypothetical protein